jgi:hypothetical protein
MNVQTAGYGGWRLPTPPSRGGAGHSLFLHRGDRASLADLKVEFAQMPLDALASVWVAMVVDSIVIGGEYTAGDIARALIVVAERLHSVIFPNPIVARLPVSHTGEAVVMDTTSLGFTVNTEAPLPPAKQGSRGAPDALGLAMEALEPGQHIKIDMKKWTAAKVNTRLTAAKKRTGRKDLASYTTDDGSIVVYATNPAATRRGGTSDDARTLIQSRLDAMKNRAKVSELADTSLHVEILRNIVAEDSRFDIQRERGGGEWVVRVK